MIAIPIKINDNEMRIAFVLNPENMDRIKNYDPATFEISKLPREWKRLEIIGIMVGYATEEEIKDISERCSKGENVYEVIHSIVARGWKYKPEQGDSDEPYTVKGQFGIP
jgi:hypothetical protein